MVFNLLIWQKGKFCWKVTYTWQTFSHSQCKFCHINFCQSRKIGFRSRQWKGQLLGKRNHFLHMALALMTASQVSVVKTRLVHINVSWIVKFYLLIYNWIIWLKLKTYEQKLAYLICTHWHGNSTVITLYFNFPLM